MKSASLDNVLEGQVERRVKAEPVITPAPLMRRSFLAAVTTTGMAGTVACNSARGEELASGNTSRDEQATMREKLLACLGGPWPPSGPLDLRREGVTEQDGFRRERISYLVEPHERVAAWLLIPSDVNAEHPAPGICVWHQHAGQYDVGKDEPAGVRAPNFGTMHMTGVALAREGYVVLCPDAAGFGERNRPPHPDAAHPTQGRDLEHFLFGMYVAAGKSLAWKNILDMRRAVDCLASCPEVHSDRLGCYGHSMGSTHTWLLGPWEPRLKALVGNCCLPTYAAMERTNLIHCFPNYIPGWRPYGDIPDIVALTAPRPLHLNLGELDDGSPVDEVREAMPQIAAAYAAQNAAEKFTYFIEPGTGHVLSDAMWSRVQQHFAKYLH